jgi:four helix bundle protein
MSTFRGNVRRIRNFRELVVWQKSMDLAAWCCRTGAELPQRTGGVLGPQIQRTAISIPSNIAEGHELSTASYRQHLRIALGSVAELSTQLELAARLDLVPEASWQARQNDVEEIERMLRSLRAALRRRAEEEKLAATRKTAPGKSTGGQ